MENLDHVEIVRATSEIIAALCAKAFREKDVQECQASSGYSAQTAVRRGFARSPKTWAIMLNGRPVAAFGASYGSMLSGVGVPWLLGCEELNHNAEVRKALRKRSKEFRDLLLGEFDRLENWEDLRNGVSLKWLKWLGFKMDEPKPYGVSGLLFIRFWMDRGSNV